MGKITSDTALRLKKMATSPYVSIGVLTLAASAFVFPQLFVVLASAAVATAAGYASIPVVSALSKSLWKGTKHAAKTTVKTLGDNVQQSQGERQGQQVDAEAVGRAEKTGNPLVDALIRKLESNGITVINDWEKAQEVIKNLPDKYDYLKRNDNSVYGFVYQQVIYLNPKEVHTDVPIHEYTHLWAEALRQNNPNEWAHVRELLRSETQLWNIVKDKYPHLKNDDEIADEVLANYSGRRGAKMLEQYTPEGMSPKKVFKNVLKALSLFWKQTAKSFGIHYDTAESVADRVLHDMLKGLKPNEHIDPNVMTLSDEGPLSAMRLDDDYDKMVGRSTEHSPTLKERISSFLSFFKGEKEESSQSSEHLGKNNVSTVETAPPEKFPLAPEYEARVREIIELSGGFAELGENIHSGYNNGRGTFADETTYNGVMVGFGPNYSLILSGTRHKDDGYYEDYGDVSTRLTDFEPVEQANILANLEKGYQKLLEKRQELVKYAELPGYENLKREGVGAMSYTTVVRHLEVIGYNEKRIDNITSHIHNVYGNDAVPNHESLRKLSYDKLLDLEKQFEELGIIHDIKNGVYGNDLNTDQNSVSIFKLNQGKNAGKYMCYGKLTYINKLSNGGLSIGRDTFKHVFDDTPESTESKRDVNRYYKLLKSGNTEGLDAFKERLCDEYLRPLKHKNIDFGTLVYKTLPEDFMIRLSGYEKDLHSKVSGYVSVTQEEAVAMSVPQEGVRQQEPIIEKTQEDSVVKDEYKVSNVRFYKSSDPNFFSGVISLESSSKEKSNLTIPFVSFDKGGKIDFDSSMLDASFEEAIRREYSKSLAVDVVVMRTVNPSARFFTPEQAATVNNYLGLFQSSEEKEAAIKDLMSDALEIPAFERTPYKWKSDVRDELADLAAGVRRIEQEQLKI